MWGSTIVPAKGPAILNMCVPSDQAQVMKRLLHIRTRKRIQTCFFHSNSQKTVQMSTHYRTDSELYILRSKYLKRGLESAHTVLQEPTCTFLPKSAWSGFTEQLEISRGGSIYTPEMGKGYKSELLFSGEPVVKDSPAHPDCTAVRMINYAVCTSTERS